MIVKMKVCVKVSKKETRVEWHEVELLAVRANGLWDVLDKTDGTKGYQIPVD